ncbi:hypothetical protein [Nostoc sp. DedSLP04]|nr:hypothetical protein [Nostoc sp. DedSLP04]MDZ8034444.1 hypothetical protein [Nostoc sp. DedSLP04]
MLEIVGIPISDRKVRNSMAPVGQAITEKEIIHSSLLWGGHLVRPMN